MGKWGGSRLSLGATFLFKKPRWLNRVGFGQLFCSCTATKFRKPASRWLSSFPGAGSAQHGMSRPRGIAIGCFKFALRTTCAGPPTAVANVLSPFPHKITDARAWAPIIESGMTGGVYSDCTEAGKTSSAICCNAIGPTCPARRTAATRSGTGLRFSSGGRSPGLPLPLGPGHSSRSGGISASKRCRSLRPIGTAREGGQRAPLSMSRQPRRGSRPAR